MASGRDYYEVLGVRQDATQAEIKKAFRKLAFECHPDHNHQDGAEDRFKEINEAYQVLSDPEKRANYDRFGQAVTGSAGRGFEGFGDFVSGLGDIFEAFFGGATGTARRAPQQGADLRAGLTISFEESVFGCEKDVEIVRNESCPHCYGVGSNPGSQPSKCPACNGTGHVSHVYQSIFGRFVNRAVCERCYGKGSVAPPCTKCQGSGIERRECHIDVKVPAGVENGSTIRLSGEGEAGRFGGPAGDLYVTLTVLEHELFKRRGNDIIYELPLNFAQAALGDEVEIPTLNGKASLKIPPETQTGKVFRLKEKGVPYLHRGGRGDQLVLVRLVTPRNLTEEQAKLLRELGKSLPEAELPEDKEDKGILGRIKDAIRER